MGLWRILEYRGFRIHICEDDLFCRIHFLYSTNINFEKAITSLGFKCGPYASHKTAFLNYEGVSREDVVEDIKSRIDKFYEKYGVLMSI